jgi:hypothetical protein
MAERRLRAGPWRRPAPRSRIFAGGRMSRALAIDKGDGETGTAARNRVTPTGDIEAIPLRGAWTGNRGILHSGHEIVRFHASDLWITCALEFRGRWHEQWQPRHYTFLYFHDEAVSFAAGHRPCAECRRDSYDSYREAWAEGLGVDLPSAKTMNRHCTATGSFAGRTADVFTRCLGPICLTAPSFCSTGRPLSSSMTN